jgi:hypothetical protein
MSNIKVVYRISDAGYNKVKPLYINNANCLQNAVRVFGKENFQVIADNVSEETKRIIRQSGDIEDEQIDYVSVGHGAGTFNLALDWALKQDEETLVYFLENDYIHKPNSDKILLEGIALGADYVSLYDHPDKYIPANRGGNPFVDVDGGEITKIYLSESCHWKLANSTTMTFAGKVKSLKRDEEILRKWTNMGDYPRDFDMFLELRDNGVALMTPIPGHSTHGETAWLSPLTDWSQI